MKKIFKIIFIFSVIILILSGCSMNSNNVSLNDKVKQELLYLDTEIISLINLLNNISIQNYKIDTKEISLRQFFI